MPTDTRSAVAEAIERLSAEPSDSEPADTSPEPVESSGDTGREVEAAPEPEADQGSPGRDRDDKGRFAKGPKEPARQEKPTSPPARPADAGQGAPDAVDAAAAAPALPKLKAPQDWRAAARDEFDKAPRAVQEEILRTYAETRKTLDRNAALEKDAGGWKEPLAPYEPMARRYGVPLQHLAAETLRLREIIESGPAQMSAQAIVQVFRNRHGSDEAAMKLLADAWHGIPTQPQTQPQQFRDPRFDQFLAEKQEQEKQAALREWEAFKPAADLLNEPGVRQDLVELTGKWLRENPNQQPTKEVFQKLYDRACLMNDGALKVVNQRKEAAAAKAKASTSAAAASGVKNEPAGPSNAVGPAKDTREEVARLMKRARQARV